MENKGKVKEFFETVSKDENLKNKIQELNNKVASSKGDENAQEEFLESLVKLAKENGYNISAEEIVSFLQEASQNGELSDDMLAMASGGWSGLQKMFAAAGLTLSTVGGALFGLSNAKTTDNLPQKSISQQLNTGMAVKDTENGKRVDLDKELGKKVDDDSNRFVKEFNEFKKKNNKGGSGEGTALKTGTKKANGGSKTTADTKKTNGGNQTTTEAKKTDVKKQETKTVENKGGADAKKANTSTATTEKKSNAGVNVTQSIADNTIAKGKGDVTNKDQQTMENLKNVIKDGNYTVTNEGGDDFGTLRVTTKDNKQEFMLSSNNTTAMKSICNIANSHYANDVENRANKMIDLIVRNNVNVSYSSSQAVGFSSGTSAFNSLYSRAEVTNRIKEQLGSNFAFLTEEDACTFFEEAQIEAQDFVNVTIVIPKAVNKIKAVFNYENASKTLKDAAKDLEQDLKEDTFAKNSSYEALNGFIEKLVGDLFPSGMKDEIIKGLRGDLRKFNEETSKLGFEGNDLSFRLARELCARFQSGKVKINNIGLSDAISELDIVEGRLKNDLGTHLVDSVHNAAVKIRETRKVHPEQLKKAKEALAEDVVAKVNEANAKKSKDDSDFAQVSNISVEVQNANSLEALKSTLNKSNGDFKIVRDHSTNRKNVIRVDSNKDKNLSVTIKAINKESANDVFDLLKLVKQNGKIDNKTSDEYAKNIMAAARGGMAIENVLNQADITKAEIGNIEKGKDGKFSLSVTTDNAILEIKGKDDIAFKAVRSTLLSAKNGTIIQEELVKRLEEALSKNPDLSASVIPIVTNKMSLQGLQKDLNAGNGMSKMELTKQLIENKANGDNDKNIDQVGEFSSSSINQSQNNMKNMNKMSQSNSEVMKTVNEWQSGSFYGNENSKNGSTIEINEENPYNSFTPSIENDENINKNENLGPMVNSLQNNNPYTNNYNNNPYSYNNNDNPYEKDNDDNPFGNNNNYDNPYSYNNNDNPFGNTYFNPYEEDNDDNYNNMNNQNDKISSATANSFTKNMNEDLVSQPYSNMNNQNNNDDNPFGNNNNDNNPYTNNYNNNPYSYNNNDNPFGNTNFNPYEKDNDDNPFGNNNNDDNYNNMNNQNNTNYYNMNNQNDKISSTTANSLTKNMNEGLVSQPYNNYNNPYTNNDDNPYSNNNNNDDNPFGNDNNDDNDNNNIILYGDNKSTYKPVDISFKVFDREEAASFQVGKNQFYEFIKQAPFYKIKNEDLNGKFSDNFPDLKLEGYSQPELKDIVVKSDEIDKLKGYYDGYNTIFEAEQSYFNNLTNKQKEFINYCVNNKKAVCEFEEGLKEYYLYVEKIGDMYQILIKDNNGEFSEVRNNDFTIEYMMEKIDKVLEEKCPNTEIKNIDNEIISLNKDSSEKKNDQ